LLLPLLMPLPSPLLQPLGAARLKSLCEYLFSTVELVQK
jgi:hypothetical protein